MRKVIATRDSVSNNPLLFIITDLFLNCIETAYGCLLAVRLFVVRTVVCW